MAEYSPRCKAYPECFCGAMGWITPCPKPNADAAEPITVRDGVARFVCASCYIEVYSFGAANAGPRCVTCVWLDSVPEEHREEMRNILDPHGNAYMSLWGDAAATELDAAVNQIRPILADRTPQMQGTILAELLSIWLAGHPVAMRGVLLALHCDAVLEMAELLDEERSISVQPPRSL